MTDPSAPPSAPSPSSLVEAPASPALPASPPTTGRRALVLATGAGMCALAAAAGGPSIALVLAPLVAIPYAILTLLLSVRVTRLRASRWWVLPFAFAGHHLVYYFGILWGISSPQEKQTHAGS